MKSFTSWTQQDKGHALADQIAPMTTVTMATTTLSMKYLIRAYRLEKAHIQTRSVGTTKSRQGNGGSGHSETRYTLNTVQALACIQPAHVD